LATDYNKYEAVIGLEVHIQLLTESKAFSSDTNAFGERPNTNVSPVSLGHPGTLPRINTKQIEYAVRLGLAVGADINKYNEFARKNYFYPDLPKGYQITQDTTPICTNGAITINIDGQEKQIHLTRIHMEEDSGKSIHDQDPFNTLVDLNRAGVPLLEIVSEPEIRSGDEAQQYLQEVRRLIRYLDISDGNMEEGSMRCDANISVRLRGTEAFGTRAEVKNMNSFSHVKQAINYEIKRQIDLIEQGGTVVQETRGFNPLDSSTFSMRSKEAANDYRYFPEPDLPPHIIEETYIDSINAKMPPLPNALKRKYIEELGLSEYDSSLLVDNKAIALYFEEMITYTKNYKSAANWLMGPVKSYLNQQAISISDFPVSAKHIATLIALIDSEKITNTMATQQVFPAMLNTPEKSPQKLAEELNLIVENDVVTLKAMINEVLNNYPEKVQAYKNGQKGLMGLFMGEVMKLSKGKANPKETTKLLNQLLNQ